MKLSLRNIWCWSLSPSCFQLQSQILGRRKEKYICIHVCIQRQQKELHRAPADCLFPPPYRLQANTSSFQQPQRDHSCWDMHAGRDTAPPAGSTSLQSIREGKYLVLMGPQGTGWRGGREPTNTGATSLPHLLSSPQQETTQSSQQEQIL